MASQALGVRTRDGVLKGKIAAFSRTAQEPGSSFFLEPRSPSFLLLFNRVEYAWYNW